MTAKLAPEDVLLLALGTTCDGTRDSIGMPRANWAIRMLVEQLIVAAPPDSEMLNAIVALSDPKRGVTNASVAQALNILLRTDAIIPVGVGDDAVWKVSPGTCDRLREITGTLTIVEQQKIRAACQRACDNSVAWSKTAAAWAERRSTTSTSA